MFIKRGVYWYRELQNVNNEYGLVYDFKSNSFNEWKKFFVKLRDRIRLTIVETAGIKARNSLFSATYKLLNYNLKDEAAYFNNNFNINDISLIIKIRAELLNLNYKRYNSEIPQICSMCNKKELDSVFHFMATCPILKEFRRIYFNEDFLSMSQLEEYLNGKKWDLVLKYCRMALKYRQQLVAEFNFI